MLLEDIEKTVKNRRSAVAYIHGDEQLTWTELHHYANDICAGLLRGGLKPGEKVGIRLEASVDYPAVCLGIWRSGGVVVPLDPAVNDPDLSYYIDVARIRWLITRSREGTGATRVRQLNIHATSHHPSSIEDARAEDDMLVLFTSGTTGAPKGVVHTRSSIDQLVRRHVRHSGVTRDDVLLASSVFHTGMGLHTFITEPLFVGAKVVIVHPFLPRVACAVARDQKVTRLQTVPAGLKLLAAVEGASVPTLKAVRVHGDVLDESIREEFIARFGLRPIVGYGMNEVGRIASTTDIPDATGRTVGYPELDVRVFTDDGKPSPAGGLGEIGVRSPNLCRPWYLLEGGKREPLAMRGDYFLTGDLGRLSEEGILELVGRRKFFILTSRHKVDPHEVQDVVVRHPRVVEAAIIPARGAAGYDLIKAVVVTAGPVASTELIAFCRDRLPLDKCPQVIEFVDKLPRNALGKIEIAKLQHTTGTR